MAGRSGRRRRRGRSKFRRVLAWFERGILGVMMTVVALVVERRLLKAVRDGGTSKKALEKAARDAEREDQAAARPGVGLGLGPDQGGSGAERPSF